MTTSVLARNLINLISNKSFEDLESIPDTLHRVYLINLGTRGHGMIIFNDFVLKANPKVPLFDIQKAKNLIKWLNLGDLQGKKIQGCIINLQYFAMDFVFKVFQTRLTTCLPCHISRAAESREQIRLRKNRNRTIIQEKLI